MSDLTNDKEFIIIKIRARPYTGFEYRISKDLIKEMTPAEIVQEVKTYMKNFFRNPYDLPFLRAMIGAQFEFLY